MPGLYKDEGVVLRTIKLGEADRIVTVFARQSGKIRAVAKGVRKTKSRFGGRLEPFTHVSLMVYRGRELDTITQAEILTSFKEVRGDYTSMVRAGTLAEMLDKITPDHERSFPVYSLLLSGLQAIASGKGASVVPAFYIKLLSLSGYHPQLASCAGCGATEGYGGFSSSFGGAVCETCWTDDRESVRIPFERIRLLERLLSEDFGTQAGDRDAFELTKLLKGYAEYHLERPLRAAALLPHS